MTSVRKARIRTSIGQTGLGVQAKAQWQVEGALVCAGLYAAARHRLRSNALCHDAWDVSPHAIRSRKQAWAQHEEVGLRVRVSPRRFARRRGRVLPASSRPILGQWERRQTPSLESCQACIWHGPRSRSPLAADTIPVATRMGHGVCWAPLLSRRYMVMWRMFLTKSRCPWWYGSDIYSK